MTCAPAQWLASHAKSAPHSTHYHPAGQVPTAVLLVVPLFRQLHVLAAVLQDAAAVQLNNGFIKSMQDLEAEIIKINKSRLDWTRCEPRTSDKAKDQTRTNNASWGTVLIPGSAAGLTLRGVPYSVSI